jgi:hypothetical protein
MFCISSAHQYWCSVGVHKKLEIDRYPLVHTVIMAGPAVYFGLWCIYGWPQVTGNRLLPPSANNWSIEQFCNSQNIRTNLVKLG